MRVESGAASGERWWIAPDFAREDSPASPGRSSSRKPTTGRAGRLAAAAGSARFGPRMADQLDEKECCARTRTRWLRRIAAHYTSFPVIKDVPCDECREILEIRVYDRPAA